MHAATSDAFICTFALAVLKMLLFEVHFFADNFSEVQLLDMHLPVLLVLEIHLAQSTSISFEPHLPLLGTL